MAKRLFVELGTADVARALGVTQRTVQRRVRSGALAGTKRGRRYVVPTPTKVAARALGVSTATVRRRASTGELRRFRGTDPEAERQYAPRPPEELADTARAEEPGFDVQRAREWLDRTGPGWLSKLVEGGPALPVEAGIIWAEAGLPPPEEWGANPAASITPYSDGTARVVIVTGEDTFDLGRMPAMVAWDMRRAFAAIDVEVEVEDTP